LSKEIDAIATKIERSSAAKSQKHEFRHEAVEFSKETNEIATEIEGTSATKSQNPKFVNG
jgi:hypothetical protein